MNMLFIKHVLVGFVDCEISRVILSPTMYIYIYIYF